MEKVDFPTNDIKIKAQFKLKDPHRQSKSL